MPIGKLYKVKQNTLLKFLGPYKSIFYVIFLKEWFF